MTTKIMKLFNKMKRRGNGETTKFHRFAIMVFVLFALGIGNAWASHYYSDFTAKTAKVEDTAAGLVYAAGEDSEGTIDAYMNPYHPDVYDGDSEEERTWYAWAKAGRGFEFVAWTKGNNINSNGDLNSTATTFVVKCSKSDGDYVYGDATATFKHADAYTVTFKQPTNFGAYSIDYSNIAVNSAGTAFEDYEPHYEMTTSSADKAETSYATDKITVEATARVNDFLGWYDGENNLLSSEVLYWIYPSSDITISGRWKVARPNIPMTFKAVENDKNGDPKGYYMVGDVKVESEDYVISSGSTYYLEKTLTADPAEGYAFTGWYTLDGKKKNFVSYDNPFNAYFDSEVTLYANFTYSNYTEEVQTQFKVRETDSNKSDYIYFTDLNDANNHVKDFTSASRRVIVCSRDGILVPGNYTISKGVTLYIPYSTAETSQTTPAYTYFDHDASKSDPDNPYPLSTYRKLSLAEGANIICNGTICVGGQLASQGGGYSSGFPFGTCGMIDMSAGGHIDLNSEAVLYAWGFIKGQDMSQGNNTVNVGTITAHKDATVWESFSGENRGGSACSALAGEGIGLRCFPFQGYIIQNIEVPVTYKYGSSLWAYTYLYISGNRDAQVPIIGSSSSLFLLKDKRSTVTKWYDPTTDLACYELKGTAQLDAIVATIYVEINSGNFNMPISSNMHVILDDCEMTLAKPIQILPDAIIEIKKNATINLLSNIFLYDKDDWKQGVASRYYATFDNLTDHKNRGDGSSKKTLSDAKLIVDGTLKVMEGSAIYSSSGGANVMGNGGGKIVFETTKPSSSSKLYQLWGGAAGTEAGAVYTFTSFTGGKTYVHDVDVYAANLCNEDSTYTRSESNKTFYNVKGRWFIDGKEGEKADHTYDFTYMAGENIGEENENKNAGDDVLVSALYGADKTGLTAGERWANVEQDATCTETYNCLQDLNSYTADKIKYIYPNNAWLQLIKTNTEGVYSGSDNNLYGLEGCTFTASDPIDENCLYTLGGVKKALVGGAFIPVVANELDAAYHQADDESKFYLCFQGCNWHPATPYVNEDSQTEPKAYVVDEGIYIWYNGDWMLVQREKPFFYVEDEQSGAKTYYEYENGEWIVAKPYIEVEGALETREFFSLKAALAMASLEKTSTIRILRDFTSEEDPSHYSSANSTCTLDLNGHVATVNVKGSRLTAVNMITISSPSSTFTITDNSASGIGELRIIASVSNPTNTTNSTARWTGIYVQDGSLTLEKGKVYVEHPTRYADGNHSGYIRGILVAANKSFTMNNGAIEVKAEYNPYGIQIAEGSATTTSITINDGTVDAIATKADSPYAISGYGTINVNGGTIKASALASTSARGVNVSASTSNQGVLKVTRGTIEAYSKNTSYGVYVNWNYTMNTKEPNTVKTKYPAQAIISGGTIKATTFNGNTAEGIRSYGTTNISGGEVIVRPSGTTAYGVRILEGVTTISDNAYIDVESTSSAYGVHLSDATPEVDGRVYNPILQMNGGELKVNARTGATAYGVYVGGGKRRQPQAYDNDHKSYRKGNYVNAGTATINGGLIDVHATTTDAYMFFVKDSFVLAADADLNMAAAKIAPKCTVNGGKFKVSSGTANKSYVSNTIAKAADFKVYSGYYNNIKTNANSTIPFSTYIVSPKSAVALTNASGNCPDENYPTYTHKVAEAYLVTFMDGESTLQSTLQNAGSPAVFNGSEPFKENNGDYSYEFDGWAMDLDAEDADYAKGTVLPDVSEAATTYYAHYKTTDLKYVVEWDANGGTCDTEYTRVDPNSAVGVLPVASMTGYDFAGWFTNADVPVTTETHVTYPYVTYYAHYTVHSHTLTWNANGGDIAGTAHTSGSVNYGASITAPANANVTRTGYTFAGWNTTPAPTMPDNDLTYTAQWTPNTNTAYKVKHYKQKATWDGYDTPWVEDYTGTTAAWVTPATTSYEGFKTPATKTQQIAADGSMVVEYYYDRITYTIVFDANGGTCDQTPVTINYGETLGLLVMPSASKAGNDFDAWYTKAVGGDKVTTETTFKWNIGTIYAQFIPQPKIELGEASEETQTISGNSTVTNVVVHTQGHLKVTSGTLKTTNLYLEANGDASGEITGNVEVTGNAYFDLTLNTELRHWRAFSVPFEIDLKQDPILADGVSMPLGVQYDIVYYDGSVRASQGKVPDCWRYVEDDTDWILTPGKAYMIVFGRNVNTVRFTKKNNAPIAYTGEFAVNKNTATTGVTSDGGWNGIGNPATYHTLLDAGVMECQVHNGEAINSDGYTLYDLTGKLVVGKAVFVQVGSTQDVDVMHATTEPAIAAKAPRRTHVKAQDERIDVQIAPVDGEMEDRIFVLAEEEKEDKYVILKDLAKAGISTVRAQMWVERYNTKLCKNTAQLVDGSAEYPLGIFAPQAGDYEISIANDPNEESTIYLTLDGSPIWNLSYAPYIAELEKGTTKQYGLKMVCSKAPAIATPIDNTQAGLQPTAQKILLNGKVYILRGGELYSVTGAKVK